MEATTSISQIISLTQSIVNMNLAYLGICVTIILFAGGLFYLFNLKPLQESIEKQENKLTSLSKEIDTKVDNVNNEVNNLILNQTKELRTLIDRTKNEIDLFKKDIDAKISKAFQGAQKESKKLKEQYQISELENLWREYYMWDGREVYANSLDTLIRYMEKAFEYNKLFLTELWLSTTLDTLTKIKSYDHRDKTEIKTRLLTILGKIIDYEEEKEELKGKINSIF